MGPKDRVPAPNYREVVLPHGDVIAVLEVNVPRLVAENAIAVKVDRAGRPLSCALVNLADLED